MSVFSYVRLFALVAFLGLGNAQQQQGAAFAPRKSMVEQSLAHHSTKEPQRVLLKKAMEESGKLNKMSLEALEKHRVSEGLKSGITVIAHSFYEEGDVMEPPTVFTLDDPVDKKTNVRRRAAASGVDSSLKKVQYGISMYAGNGNTIINILNGGLVASKQDDYYGNICNAEPSQTAQATWDDYQSFYQYFGNERATSCYGQMSGIAFGETSITTGCEALYIGWSQSGSTSMQFGCNDATALPQVTVESCVSVNSDAEASNCDPSPTITYQLPLVRVNAPGITGSSGAKLVVKVECCPEFQVDPKQDKGGFFGRV